MNDDDLRVLHSIQLEMAKEVKRVSELLNVNCFLIAGTLLGAKRHSGFIPWDDDMDLGMLRKDYETFLLKAPELLGKKYFLQTWHSDKHFGLPMAKIRCNGTLYCEETSKNVDIHQGISIDLFPFDAVPDDKIKMLHHKSKGYLLKRMILLKSRYSFYDKTDIKKVILFKVISGLNIFFSKDFLVRIFEQHMGKYDAMVTRRITNFGGAYSYDRESLMRQWLGDFKTVSFEGVEFKAPERMEEMLVSLYGDYMKLPPVDQRENRHQLLKIDFGEENHI